MLHYMSERIGEVVTRDELLQRVWGFQTLPSTRCIDNLIARLRMKVESDPHQPKYLRTAHGDGYRLILDDHQPAGFHKDEEPTTSSV